MSFMKRYINKPPIRIIPAGIASSMMKQGVVIGSLVVLLLSAAVLRAEEVNLVQDPGFEEMSKVWRDNNWAKLDAEFAFDTEVFHGGSTSKRITLHTSDPKKDLQMGQWPMTFEQDQTKLQFKFWMKSKGAGGPVKIIIRDLGMPYKTYAAVEAQPEEAWTEYSFDLDLLDTVVGKSVGLIFSFTDERTVWIDDVSMIAPAATPGKSPAAQKPVPSAASPASPRPDPSTLAAKLQHYVDEQMMAGAVLLVADKDKTLDLEAFGWSDVAAKKPMRPNDLFWIASMTKSITAAALMMLVDEGKVSVDDPVEKYIPEFANLKVKRPDGTLTPPSHPLLVREILSHTSGMGFLNSKDRHRIDSVPLADSVQHALLEPLQSDPGTKYSYSNEGIDAAGRIVEIVSGIPYEKFLRDRLITPLGMVDTTFWPTADQVQRLAKTYKTTTDKKAMEEVRTPYLTYPLDGPNRYPAPGGGLFSTAADVSRFCQMLLNSGTFEGKTYLSKEAVLTMTTRQTGPLLPNNSYGFGILSSGDGKSFGHGGALKTSMGVDHGQVRVFLVQKDGDWSGTNPSADFDTEAKKLYPLTRPGAAMSVSPVGAHVSAH